MVTPNPEELAACALARIEARTCPGCGRVPYPRSAGLWWTCEPCTETLGRGLGIMAARLLKGELRLPGAEPEPRPRRPIPRPIPKPRRDW